jgi:thiol-disulfide isomerase/thioredoxin
MKNRKIYSFLIFLICFIGCSLKQTDNYRIIGSVGSDYDGQMVMLFVLLGDSIVSVDTTIVKKGAFRFTGKEFVHDLSVITMGNFPDRVLSTEVLLERGKIKVHLDSISVVMGGNLQSVFTVFTDSLSVLTKEAYALYMDLGWNSTEYIDAAKIMKDFTLETLRANANNAIGKTAFGSCFFYITDEELYEVYDLFDDITVSNPDIIRDLKDRQRMKDEETALNSVLNMSFLDFDVQTLNGTERKLSDFIGKSKYLFIDFWASWCGPCIAQKPHIENIYNTYKSQGLDVLGVSLDRSESEWKRSVQQHKVSWEMVRAIEDTEVWSAYKINGIPYGILLDEQGVIIEVGLRAPMMPTILKKYFE